MNFSWDEIVPATMVLFAIIDILGSVPIVINLQKNVGEISAIKASGAALIIMLVFLFLGDRILAILGVDVNSFAVAGSFVLFFLALEMILGIRLYKDEEPKSAAIIPLAFPLIAGAGTLTTLVSIRAEYALENIVVAIVINMLLVFLVLRSAKRIEVILGESGLGVLRKVFGVVLLALSVKLFATNIQTLFNP